MAGVNAWLLCSAPDISMVRSIRRLYVTTLKPMFGQVGGTQIVDLVLDEAAVVLGSDLSASDPAVLRLIEITLETACRFGVASSLCGQMSGNPLYTMLLIGMGLRSFSLAPGAIPEVKRIVRSVTVPQCQTVARHAMEMDNAQDITSLLKEELRKSVPEVAIH